MKVSQLLQKKGGRIVSIRMDETIERAAQMLRDENIGALVIKDSCNTEGDVVVGMFSEQRFSARRPGARPSNSQAASIEIDVAECDFAAIKRRHHKSSRVV